MQEDVIGTTSYEEDFDPILPSGWKEGDDIFADSGSWTGESEFADEQAEDAVQETYLKAYKSLDHFRGESSEKTWLFHIGVNVCRDMRRSRWFRYVDRRVTPDTLPMQTDPADEDHEDLSQAIVRLPDKYKEVILLHYYQNMNIREIGQTLGLAPSSVSNRLKKARERLRVLMERGSRHG